MSLMEKFADPSLFVDLGFGEKMMGSFVTMLMGMGTTFVVLCLLWTFVALMGKFMGIASKGDKASAKTEAAAAPSGSQTAVAPIKSDDEVIAAVIAAAVAAYQGSGGTGNLVVRKISRLSGETTLWTNAAREDCIASRKF